MALNITLIVILSIFLANIFRRHYLNGMYVSIFLLLLLPTNLSIEISAAMPSVTIHRVILVMMLFFWAGNNKVHLATFLRSPFSKVLILLFVSMFISFLFSDIFIISSKRYLYYLFESLIFYVILVTSITERKQLLNIVLSVSLGILATSIVGIIERYTSFEVIDLFGEKLSYGVERIVYDIRTVNMVTAVYPHRILYGISCAAGLVYFLYLPGLIKRRWNFFTWFIPIMLISTALYFSMSRGPWLAGMLAIGFSTLANPRYFFKKSFLLGTIVVIAFTLRPGTLDTIASLYHSTVDSSTLKGSSFRWRFSVVEVALDQTLNSGVEHMFFGFGAGSHLYAEPVVIQTSTGHDNELYSWDCEYAIILYENGFMGMLLLGFLYSEILLLGLLYMKRHPSDRMLMSLAISTLLIIMFMKSNVSFFSSHLNYIEYINIAIVSILLMYERRGVQAYRQFNNLPSGE